MELDNLKLAWQQTSAANKNTLELKNMIKENRHPVLKGIRLQMIIEITAWAIFLFLYHDMFDGHRKPFYLNLLLVMAVIFLLVHSTMGYLSAKKLVKGTDIKYSLQIYLSRVKVYAVVSVVSRVVTIASLLFFFIAPISFTPHKYMLLAGILLILPVQAFLLSRIWNSRIKKLKSALASLNETEV